MSKRCLGFILFMFAVSILFSGCGSINTEQSNAELSNTEQLMPEQSVTGQTDESEAVGKEISVESANAELEEMKASREEIITIGGYGTVKWIKETVNKFNLSQDQYWVEIKKYDSFDNLMLDIARKQGPDIFYMWYTNIDVLAKKGVLEDLTPYFEKSEIVKKEDVVSAVWRAGLVEDKMVCVIPRFFPMVYLVEKGYTENGGWTVEDYLALAEKYPEGMLNERVYDPADMLRNSLAEAMNDYINWEEKTCSFDSDSFVELLERLKAYSEKKYEVPSGTVAEQLYDKTLLTYKVSLFRRVYMNGYKDLKPLLEFCEIAGMPNQEGKPLYTMIYEEIYSMNAGSEKKEAAWVFLEYLLSIEYQTNVLDGYFSARKDILESGLQTEVERDPELIPYSVNKYTEERAREVFTEEDKQAFLELIENTYRVESLNMYELNRISTHELDYFFEGTKSAEEVARIIQNRMSLYLME